MVAPTLKVTVPVGVAPEPDTIAEYITDCPNTAVEGFDGAMVAEPCPTLIDNVAVFVVPLASVTLNVGETVPGRVSASR